MLMMTPLLGRQKHCTQGKENECDANEVLEECPHIVGGPQDQEHQDAEVAERGNGFHRILEASVLLLSLEM